MPSSIEDWDIRNDQRYLYRMIIAIHTGVCSDTLASEKPGPVSTARWLTTAARILRLFVTTDKPDTALANITEFIMKVYAPFWFLVKSKPNAVDGSRNVFQYIIWMRCLPTHVQTIIQKSIGNNGYYFHHENIILSMITDTDVTIRQKVYDLKEKRDQIQLRLFVCFMHPIEI